VLSIFIVFVYLIKGEDLCSNRYKKKQFYKFLIYLFFTFYFVFKIIFIFYHKEDFKPNEYSLFILFILNLLKNSENSFPNEDEIEEESLNLELTNKIYIFFIYFINFFGIINDTSIINFIKFILLLFMFKNFWLYERSISKMCSIIYFYLNLFHIFFVSIIQYIIKNREKEENIVFLCQLILKQDIY